MAKVKERIPKPAGEKQTANYKGTSIRLLADVSMETRIKVFWKKGSSEIYSKPWKRKICNPEYSTQQDYHLEQREK